MALVELGVRLEDRLEIELPDECLLELETVGDLARLVEERVSHA